MKWDKDQPLEELRYERKFLVDELDSHHVRALVKLHPMMFVQPYPPRYVNNIYLDSEDLVNYMENVDGVEKRRKVRLRWYGDLLGDSPKTMLEFKLRQGLMNRKVQVPLGGLRVDKTFNKQVLEEFFRQNELPLDISLGLHGLSPVLINRYYRWYFATLDGRFRVTVDTALAYYNVRHLMNAFRYKFVDYKRIVVELKYQKEEDKQAERAASYFPFMVTKNSKYVTGLESVFW